MSKSLELQLTEDEKEAFLDQAKRAKVKQYMEFTPRKLDSNKFNPIGQEPPAATEVALPGVFDTKTIVNKLEDYMDRVTANECSPATVQAAVNCADKIVDILRLHLDLERIKEKRNENKRIGY